MFWKKKGYKEYYDQGFLDATFEPRESLENLKRQYLKKRTTHQNWILKAKMAGFMAGLEARNKSRLDLLEKANAVAKQQDKNKSDRER